MPRRFLALALLLALCACARPSDCAAPIPLDPRCLLTQEFP